jgi:hypothetical protein
MIAATFLGLKVLVEEENEEQDEYEGEDNG